MKSYVAFLRGINVSGQKLIKMDLLKELFATCGFKNIRTYIQSGNVIFDTKESDTGALRTKIEKRLLKELGYEVITIIRSIDEINTIITQNPFDQQKPDDDRKLYVTFLSDAPANDAVELLKKNLIGNEELSVVDKQLYMLTPAYGNTKLSNAFIEKKLGLSATSRNWATVNKVTIL